MAHTLKLTLGTTIYRLYSYLCLERIKLAARSSESQSHSHCAPAQPTFVGLYISSSEARSLGLLSKLGCSIKFKNNNNLRKARASVPSLIFII